MEDLNKIVCVHGTGVAVWDSVKYDLSQSPKLKLGVARFWESIGHSLNIVDAPEENIPPRDIVNPLAAEGQGEAFSALKKRGPKPKEG